MRLLKWLSLKNINQMMDFLLGWMGILAALVALEFFIIQPRVTIGLVKESVKFDCDILKNFYKEVGKDIPKDLLEYCEELEQEKDAIPPDWLGPTIFPAYPELLPEYTQIWDQYTPEESMLANFAIMSSQYRIFSVPVQNEGDSDVKDIYVSSVVEGIYYVDYDGTVTEKNESDKFDLKRGETKTVKFQMPSLEQLPRQQPYMLEVDLSEYFRVMYGVKARILDRGRVICISWAGAIVAFILAFIGLFTSDRKVGSMK